MTLAKEHVVVDDEGDEEILIRPKKAPVKPAALKAADILSAVSAAVDGVREKRPLVTCLTNFVSAPFVADGVAAAGASPLMVADSGEATALAGQADALLVNVGTLERTQAETMRAAVARANLSSHPWVLDPVGVGALPLRTYLSRELMRRFPAVIRGNPSEILVLAGVAGAEGGRGIDSLASGEEAWREAHRLAQVTRATVIVSGAVDYVCGENAPVVAVKNGAPAMAKIPGTGCLQGALAAAFLGALGSAHRLGAALAAALLSGVAGERAAKVSTKAGSFKAAFLDQLDTLTGSDVARAAKIEILA